MFIKNFCLFNIQFMNLISSFLKKLANLIDLSLQTSMLLLPHLLYLKKIFSKKLGFQFYFIIKNEKKNYVSSKKYNQSNIFI